jgi:hypothetical protein
MDWLKRWLPRRATAPHGADTFGRLDVPGWTMVGSTETQASWRDADGDVLSLTLADMHPGADILSSRDALRQLCRRLAQQRGAGLVEATVVTGAQGSGFRFIYKRLQAPAFVFTGMLVFPRASNSWVWTIVAGERGTTGVREAIVTGQLMETGKMDLDSYEKSWAQDPYDPAYRGVDRSTLRYVSDAAEYDGMFPDHPLSKVRRELEKLLSVRIDSERAKQSGATSARRAEEPPSAPP